MKMRIETGKPLNLNDQLNAISKGLLPKPIIGTPTAAMCKRSPNFAKKRTPNPVEYVEMFPTPVSSDATTGSIIGKSDVYYITKNNTPRKINKAGADGSLGLGRYVKFFPSPQNRDYKSGQAERINRKGKQKNLNDFVRMWPTPKASDGKGTGPYMSKSQIHDAMKRNLKGQLNADWVEILMGYPLYWTDINKDAVFEIDLPAAWLDGTWEKGIPRVITDQKNRVKRLKGLGNAVIPQLVEIILSLPAVNRWRIN
ncbi:MAG: hypothetical protein LBB81_01430 [Treponema sp.]|jgi:hypothetical protein|nr:hypothetical protein [Treponema sp.]